MSVLTTYNMLEAKTNLSRLIDALENGRESEIVIARDGRPVARLVPLSVRSAENRLGVAQGQFVVPQTIDEDNALIERLFAGGAD
jgi:antitoxin (DNA-binding transcriptional repressor) of toxin-antitoxin stability system